MTDLGSSFPESHGAAVERASFGIYRATASGKILSANPALVRLLGYASEEEVLRLDLDADVYVESGERRRILEAHDLGPFARDGVRWSRSDGEEIVVRLWGRPDFAEGSEPTSFEVFVENVTEAYRKRRHMLRALESSGAFLFTLAMDEGGAFPFRPVWASEAVRTALGYRVQEVLEPEWFYENVHPEDREEALDATHSVMDEGHVVQEFRFRRKDGAFRWFRQELQLLEDGQGGGAEIVGVCVDVTERKEVEGKLEGSQERLNRVLEAAGAFLYVLAPEDDGFRFEWLSPGVRTVLGYTRAEALEPTWFPDNLHPEARSRVIREIETLGEGGKVVHEFRFRHRNGEYRWLREDLRRLEAGPEGPPRVVGVAVDVTAQKEAETAVREGAARLRDLANAVPDGILTIDQEGRIRDLNPAAEEIYGYEPSELLGCHFDVLVPERFREENRRAFRELVGDDRLDSFDARPMRSLRKSGEEFEAEVSVAEHVTEGVAFVTTVVRDVSERRRLEQEREDLIEELRTALEEVRTLRGILPICSSCKSIRDDAGYWHRVESYIGSYSEAEFTHSICPDCAERLYGDIPGPPSGE